MDQSFEPSMRHASGVFPIAEIPCATKDCNAGLFWQNEAKMANIFKGDRLNAAPVTAVVRPFGANIV
jgi:hypothetical protein